MAPIPSRPRGLGRHRKPLLLYNLKPGFQLLSSSQAAETVKGPKRIRRTKTSEGERVLPLLVPYLPLCIREVRALLEDVCSLGQLWCGVSWQKTSSRAMGLSNGKLKEHQHRARAGTDEATTEQCSISPSPGGLLGWSRTWLWQRPGQ